MIEVKVPTVGESVRNARTTCCPSGRRPPVAAAVPSGGAFRAETDRRWGQRRLPTASADPGQQVETSAKVPFSKPKACQHPSRWLSPKGGTTGPLTKGNRPRQGSQHSGTPSGCALFHNLSGGVARGGLNHRLGCWYPSGIIRSDLIQLSHRSQVVRATNLLNSSFYAY